MRKPILYAALLSLAGCAAVQNISATDIRNEAHLRAERKLPLTITQISQALYEHQSKCSDVGRVVENPGNPNEGFITVEIMGRTKGSVALLIDLRQEGRVTNAKAYTYYSTWTGQIEKIFRAIENPADCG